MDVFKRGVEAYNHRAVEALVDDLDPEVEFRPALPALLGGAATVYRGHEGVRGMFQEFLDPKQALEAAGLRE